MPRDDIPEADALEQVSSVVEDRDEEPEIGAETPEADALEQSRVVPTPDDYDR